MPITGTRVPKPYFQPEKEPEKKSILQTKLNTIFNYGGFMEDNDSINTIREGKKFSSSYKIPQNDFVGIEVEVEYIHRREGIITLPSGLKIWNLTEDGSLRNSGKEFVSSPLKGDNIPFALSLLNKTLNSEKTCIGHEFSDRTSVHVHMDVREFTLEQLANFIMSYIIVEPLMYNFCGGNRHQSIFCVPLNISSMTHYLNIFFSQLEKNRTGCCDIFSPWPKYTGLNLRPVHNYGTVEFRHMVGTCDVDILMQWVSLILKLKVFAKGQEFAKLKERLLNLNTTSEYRLFLYEIFGDSFELIREDKLEQHMEDMVVFLKDVFINHEANGQSFISKEVVKIFNEQPDLFKFTEHAIACNYYVDVRKALKALDVDEADVEEHDDEEEEIDTEAPTNEGTFENNIATTTQWVTNFPPVDMRGINWDQVLNPADIPPPQPPIANPRRQEEDRFIEDLNRLREAQRRAQQEVVDRDARARRQARISEDAARAVAGLPPRPRRILP